MYGSLRSGHSTRSMTSNDKDKVGCEDSPAHIALDILEDNDVPVNSVADSMDNVNDENHEVQTTEMNGCEDNSSLENSDKENVEQDSVNEGQISAGHLTEKKKARGNDSDVVDGNMFSPPAHQGHSSDEQHQHLWYSVLDPIKGKNWRKPVEFKTEKDGRTEYLKVNRADTVDSIIEFMQSYWKLMPPTQVVSVVGDRECFNGRIPGNFEAVLQEFGMPSSTWIITNGSNSGIAEFVGNAMTSSFNPKIGIANWSKKECRDLNHSHFVWIEKNGDWGHRLRLAVEESLSKIVPVVILFAGGNTGDLESLLRRLKMSRMHVVVFKGTGGAANQIASVLECDKDGSSSSRIKEFFPNGKDKASKALHFCLEERSKITVLDCNNRNDKNNNILKLNASIKAVIWRNSLHDAVKAKRKKKEQIVFGEISLKQKFHSNHASFMRLPWSIGSRDVYKFILSYWGIKKPSILISVVGSYQNNNILINKRHVETTLRKLFTTPSAWIISDASIHRIGKLVLTNTRRLMNPCIGIGTWKTMDKEGLEIRSSISEDSSVTEAESSSGDKWRPDLNHSHYLLGDESNNTRTNLHYHFRKALENEICTEVPAVHVLAGGDIKVLDSLLDVITASKSFLVLQGSGGIADIISECYNDQVTDPKIYKEMLHKYFFKVQPNVIDNAVNKLMECRKRTDKIRILDCSKDSNENSIMLDLLVQDSNTDVSKLLDFALTWQAPDIADVIISGDRFETKEHHIQELILKALMKDEPNFIKLLLDKEICFRDTLSVHAMGFMYAYHAKKLSFEYWDKQLERYGLDKEQLQKKMDNMEKSEEKKIFRNELEFFQVLWQEEFPQSPFIILDYSRFLKNEFSMYFHCSFKNVLCLKGEVNDKSVKKSLDKTLFFHLFLWAILQNMPQMASIFWRYGENGLGKALLGSYICKKMIESPSKKANEATIIFQNSEKFLERLWKALLYECHKQNPQLLQSLLRHHWGYHNDTYLLRFAYKGGLQKFISHSYVQSTLLNKWRGQCSLVQTNTCSKVFICIFWILIWLTYPVVVVLHHIKGWICNKDAESPKKKKNESSESMLGEFYYTPAVKYGIHSWSYVIFLYILSMVAIQKEAKLDAANIYILLFAICSTLDEVRQIYNMRRGYIGIWNVLDCLLIGLFYAGFFMRLSTVNELRETGFIVLGASAGISFLRILEILLINETTGVYIIMIKSMFLDAVQFIVILLIFLLAYGVCASTVLRSPESGTQTFANIIFHPYFNIYGELFLGEPGNSTTRFGTTVRNSHSEAIALVLLGIYLLIANVILLNLLIAIFNHTYSQIKIEAESHWKYHRYYMVKEYNKRTTLPHPLSIINYAYKFIVFIKREFCLASKKYSDLSEDEHERITDEQERIKELTEFESQCINQVILNVYRVRDKSKLINLSTSEKKYEALQEFVI